LDFQRVVGGAVVARAIVMSKRAIVVGLSTIFVAGVALADNPHPGTKGTTTAYEDASKSKVIKVMACACDHEGICKYNVCTSALATELKHGFCKGKEHDTQTKVYLQIKDGKATPTACKTIHGM